jgi:hypothetical protein
MKVKERNNARLVAVTIGAFPAVLIAALSSGQTIIYRDDFSSADDISNYNVSITQGSTGPSSDATFAYDYSALGIPSAPNTTNGSTLGLRLRVDNLQSSVGTVVGAIEVATKGLSLPAKYVVSADVWGNYIGSTSIASSGVNGSTGTGMGVGTSGTSLQYIAGNDGLLVETFHDNGGGANQQYRVYTDNTHPNPTTAGYWAAGTSSTSASYIDPYYSFLGSHTAPVAQVAISATQGGSTPAGIIGFAWHTMTITQDGVNLTWAIDGHTIAIVPDSALTFGGSQVSVGMDDAGLTGSSVAINQLLNFDVWDNLTITDLTITTVPAFSAHVSLSPGTRQPVISFSAVSNHLYEVDYANSLVAPLQWNILASNLIGSNSVISINDTNTALQRFYRVKVL